MPYGFVFLGLLMIASAVFFYRAGEFEAGTSIGALWSVLSILTSLLVWQVMRLGFGGILVGQLLLFAGITFVRSWRKP